MIAPTQIRPPRIGKTLNYSAKNCGVKSGIVLISLSAMGEAGRNSAEWIFMGHRMVALNITVFNVKVKIITLTPNLRKKR